MKANYNLVSFNKDYISEDSFSINIHNRAFRYGDGFFESMHANGLEVQFFNDHFNRIIKAAEILKLDLPDYFTPNFLSKQISGLLSRCKLFQAARVKLTMFRSGEGLYSPITNKADFLIEAKYLGKGPYELNSEGLTIGVYNEIPRPMLPYNTIKSINAQLFVLAMLFARQNNYTDVLLVNENNDIVEASSSNVFAISHKNIYTPSLKTGCVDGIMRKQVLTIAKILNYKVHEVLSLKPDMLLDMDEVFLTNAVQGIKHVSGYEKRRYYKKNAIKFVNKLNETAF